MDIDKRIRLAGCFRANIRFSSLMDIDKRILYLFYVLFVRRFSSLMDIDKRIHPFCECFRICVLVH